MAIMITKITGDVRKDAVKYRMFGTIVHNGVRIPLHMRLRKRGPSINIFLRIECPPKDADNIFTHLSDFAKMRGALAYTIVPDEPLKHQPLKMRFSAPDRNRGFRECLSVAEYTLASIDEALAAPLAKYSS